MRTYPSRKTLSVTVAECRSAMVRHAALIDEAQDLLRPGAFREGVAEFARRLRSESEHMDELLSYINVDDRS